MILSVAKIIFCVLFLAVVSVSAEESENNRPIIGVLAQEIAHSLDQLYPGEYKSFIAASYVKFVEGGGARVVPVWIGRDDKYYADIVNKTNGILFPGGSTWFNQSNGYADAGYSIYKLAVEQNKRGNYYPLFGTCLGMEFLIYAAAGEQEYRAHCSAKNIGLPLDFKAGFEKSELFKSASKDVIESLRTKNITFNYHGYCLTEQILTDLNLANDWNILSLSTDVNGLEFVSSIEHSKYPFFGVQFHPEKNIYEWKPKKGLLHSREAIQASQYFADFFVDTARKSDNKYQNREAEMKELIYNYPVKYTGKDGNGYEQCYLFKDDNHGKSVLQI